MHSLIECCNYTQCFGAVGIAAEPKTSKHNVSGKNKVVIGVKTKMDDLSELLKRMRRTRER
jgi:hypothetical protein